MTSIARPILALSCLFLGACAQLQPDNPEFIPSDVVLDAAVEGRPSLGGPIGIPEQRVVMVPFVVEREKKWLESDDSYQDVAGLASVGSGKSYSYRSGNFRWNNIVFKNLDTGGESLLLNRRGVVTDYDILGPKVKKDDEKVLRPKVILFTVTEGDANGNGRLDAADGSVIYATSPAGSRPRRITPAGTDCVSHRYDKDTGFVFLRVRQDSNEDGQFTSLDETVPYRFAPANTKASPLVSAGTRDAADSLLR